MLFWAFMLYALYLFQDMSEDLKVTPVPSDSYRFDVLGERKIATLLKPHVPSGGVIRMSRRHHAQSPIQPDDVTVTDSFLVGRCVVAVLSHSRNEHTRNGYATLAASAIIDGIRVELSERRLLITPRWHDQGSAQFEACSDALLAFSSVPIVFRFPGRVPVKIMVSRLEPRVAPPVHSALCVLVKDVSPEHLRMWIDYYLAIGFGHAYVYINESWGDFVGRNGTHEALAPLARAGVATFIPWAYPYWYPGDDESHFAQVSRPFCLLGGQRRK